MILYFREKQKRSFLKKLGFCLYFPLIPWICLTNASEERESSEPVNSLKRRNYHDQADKDLPDQQKKKNVHIKKRGSAATRLTIISDPPIIGEEKEGRRKKQREKEVVFEDITVRLLENDNMEGKTTRTKQIFSLQKQFEFPEETLDAKKIGLISTSTVPPVAEEKADTQKIKRISNSDKQMVILPAKTTNEETANKGAGLLSSNKEKPKASSPATRRQKFSGQRSKSMGQLPQNLLKQYRSYDCIREKLPQNGYSIVIKRLFEKSKSEHRKHNLSFIEIAKLIKFTSPFFLDKDEFTHLLTTIQQYSPKQVKGFSEEYTALKSLLFFKEKPSELPMRGVFEGEYLTCPDWDIGNISKALTLGFVNLFQALTFEDIKKMVISQTKPPKVIEEIGSRFDQIANWFALQILSENEEIKRQDKIKTIFMIGRLLHEKRDYCSAAMIASVFTMAPVNRILVEEQPGKKQLQPIYLNDENWKTISCFTKAEGNFCVYHDLLKSYQGKPCLPVFSLVLRDLIHTYETCVATIQQYPKKTAIMLKEMANTLEMVSNAQSFPAEEDANIIGYLKFFWNLPGVAQETLDELSHLHKEWLVLKRLSPPPFLRDWNASHFIGALYEHSCENQVKAIFFDRHIYDGADIIKYMGNLKGEAQKDILKGLGLNDPMIGAIIASYNYQE